MTAERVLLCGTGSVASVKIPQLALALSQHYQVKILLTKSAEHFVFNVSKSYDPTSWEQNWVQTVATNNVKHSDDPSDVNLNSVIYVDEDEWNYSNIGDPILHIELRKWADLFIVAPASANTIAKLAHGLSDNLITCVARAWDFSNPILICPAMNTLMWTHPFTQQHLNVLSGIQYQIVHPVVKTLACGDVGLGAMASVGTIVAAVGDALSQSNSGGNSNVGEEVTAAETAAATKT